MGRGALRTQEASASATTADGGMMAAPTGGDGLRKRFYQRAGIKAGASGLFHVTLDGRVLRTPARNKLLLPHGLALAVAAEVMGACEADACSGRAFSDVSAVCRPMHGGELSRLSV